MQAILFSEVGVKLHFQTLILMVKLILILIVIVMEIVLAAIRVSL